MRVHGAISSNLKGKNQHVRVISTVKSLSLRSQMLENSAVSSGTNTPLPCDDLDEASDEMNEESSVSPSPVSSADTSHSLVMFWMTKRL